MTPSSKHVENPDVILIGSGIMSANLGAILKRMAPDLTVQVYEATEELAQESSNGWNNAGTGHAGICELSYTPGREADGSVNVAKAIEIFEQFEQSKQFWGYAAANGMAGSPGDFITAVPHVSFVHGEEQSEFLRARHEAMAAHHFFSKMEFTTDRSTIGRWAPLLTEGRAAMPVAATKMDQGTDVNFGILAARLLTWLGAQQGCAVATGQRVADLKESEGGWRVFTRDQATGATRENRARFVFVGAGGGSLRLLQKSGIAECRGLGGFPIGGQWLVCENPAIVGRHHAKVYGQALDSAPTMAVPHLDSRVLNGKRALLFGPFAAWTTRFLRQKGSWADLPLSVRPDNIGTLIRIGAHNLPLVRYLVQQGTQSMEERLDVLRIFYPEATAKDWRLVDAGIRVQAIKKTDGEAGIVHYGTEIITNPEGTISALLGASPGASVSVSIAIGVIRACFPRLMDETGARERLKEMIPAWNEDMRTPENAGRFGDVQAQANQRLHLV